MGVDFAKWNSDSTTLRAAQRLGLVFEIVFAPAVLYRVFAWRLGRDARMLPPRE